MLHSWAVRMIGLILGLSTPLPAQSRKLADGKQWTTHNLSIRTAGSYCYNDVKENCERYGRLYTWESAVQACPLLGKGWRLPTDDEWRRMAKQYGGVSADASDKGRAAYQALMPGGSSGFNAVLGGGRDLDGKYARADAHGFYWSATEINRDSAFYYNFGKGGLAFHRQDGGEKPRAFAVRCIRD